MRCEHLHRSNLRSRGLYGPQDAFFSHGEVSEVQRRLKTRKTAGARRPARDVARGYRIRVPGHHGHALIGTNSPPARHPGRFRVWLVFLALCRRVLFAGSASPKVSAPALSPCCLTICRRESDRRLAKRQRARPDKTRRPLVSRPPSPSRKRCCFYSGGAWQLEVTPTNARWRHKARPLAGLSARRRRFPVQGRFADDPSRAFHLTRATWSR